MSGEVSIPPQLLDFYFTLLGGCNKKRKKSMKCARQVHSYSQDVIFAVHNGHVKTPKHIMLDDMIDEVKRLQNCEISSFHIENEDLKELMNNYNIFKQRCFNANNGWILENNKYHFKWFEGDQLPSYVSDALKTQSETDGECDIDENQTTDGSSSDEDGNIDDNDDSFRSD
ncbi:uncharacterized protein TNCT_476971 [Trichonephila clavata]|uniref:Uncharacterized protein n=1 Tax=Trichonephila clavata TaxID=2740835 RepID=A0A8X6LQ87_TRICU|nr:uncharacterized protein TNCT_476971 [Trichonephila clavata]